MVPHLNTNNAQNGYDNSWQYNKILSVLVYHNFIIVLSNEHCIKVLYNK